MNPEQQALLFALIKAGDKLAFRQAEYGGGTKLCKDWEEVKTSLLALLKEK